MKIKGKQLDGFNAALRAGDEAKAHSELQKAAATAEGKAPLVAAHGSGYWHPNQKDQSYLRAIFSMTRDSADGCGVVDRETFVANLRGYANLIEKEGSQNA
jgi:hypothetical protein